VFAGEKNALTFTSGQAGTQYSRKAGDKVARLQKMAAIILSQAVA
jgi:hypothetical protein